MSMLKTVSGSFVNPRHIAAMKLAVSKKYEDDTALWEQKQELLYEFRNDPESLENVKSMTENVGRPSFSDYYVTKVTMSDGSKYEIDMPIEEVREAVERVS